MLLDLIKYQKKQIFVSDEITPTGLTDFNVDHSIFRWEPSDGDQWMKINFYESTTFDNISFEWTGDISSVSIKYSYDNINWHTVSDQFTPDNKTKVFDMDYSAANKTKTGVFLKIWFGSCVSFSMHKFSVKTNRVFDNKIFISHINTSLYPKNQLESNPFLPSITRSLLEMYENKNNKDIRLFDSSLWSQVALNSVVTGNTISLSVTSDIPIDADMYIWDFDDSVNSYIQTKNPLNDVTHTYLSSGIYYPRLIAKYSKYQLEFHKKTVI